MSRLPHLLDSQFLGLKFVAFTVFLRVAVLSQGLKFGLLLCEVASDGLGNKRLSFNLLPQRIDLGLHLGLLFLVLAV